MSNSNNGIRIEGTVAPGFESVKQLYEHNMHTLVEKNTQLCIYHNDQKVVDLWASACGDENFSADSLVNVFSSGKSLAAIAMASLVGKGLLDYSAKITNYWPEFGGAGKQDLIVADLMRHEAGLANFNVTLDPQDLLTENIKQNKIGKIIEEHPVSFRDGEDNQREYHAITRGWIINEVFRRVEPEGRTIGEFLRQDISEPMQAEAIIGATEEELTRVSPVKPLGFWFQLLESLKPKFLGRKMEKNIFQILAMIIRMIPVIFKGGTTKAPKPLLGMEDIGFFNDPVLSMGETPSAGAKCSARGLAKIAAMMSTGGRWDGREYLNETAWKALHAEPVERSMVFMPTTFTQGGVAHFDACDASSSTAKKAFNTGREGFYGWMGLGGSIFQWHPQHNIGFGYVPTSLHVMDFMNERGKAYQAEVLRCVERI